MKNQYVADINDYKKYLLIKELSKSYKIIDVCWMLTENDGRKDGRKLSYLFDESQRCDSDIYNYLRSLVLAHVKNVKAIEQGEILPVRNYYEKLTNINLNDMPELLFLDPDNGIEVKSVQFGKSGSERYLYFHQIKALIECGCDLLIYQHYPRVNRIAYQSKRDSEIFKEIGNVRVTHFNRGMIEFILMQQMV